MADTKPKADAFFHSMADTFQEGEAPGPGSSMNEKIEVLKRYPLVFRDIDVSLTMIVPILMQRKEAHLAMERVYDRQHELILKRKSLDVLDLPSVLRRMISEQTNQTRQHFIQSVSNLVYSCEKYIGKHPEFSLFLKFLQAGANPHHLLYYLFIRQHFKILTYTSFLAHKKSAADPAAILLSREQASEILRTAFSHDSVTHTLLRDEFGKIYKDRQKVPYYEFLMRMNDVKMNYKDLVLLDKLIALYSMDYEEQLRKHFEKSPKPVRGKADNIVARDSIDKAVFGSAEGNVQNMVKVAAAANEEDGLDIQDGEAPRSPSPNLKTQKPGETATPRRPKMMIARKGLENFYHAVKGHIPPFIQQLITSFPASKSFDFNKLQENCNVIGILIETKLSALVDALFAEDGKKFAKLLRDDHGLNADIPKFFDKQVEGLRREGLEEGFAEADAVGLLNALYEFPLINTQVKFLIGYRFRSEKELLELQAKERELMAHV